jgi:hypothetical protein
MIPGAGDRTSRRGESGYALLLIFLMAAVVAAMLYMELPRVAFEAQRGREELLIERGEGYKRAIQLYFRKFKTYPATIDALESTNNVRFLRRRYADPLTGKDEWRLIHVGPGGIFTDSLTRKPKTNQPQQQANLNTFITEGPAIGATQSNTQPGAAGPPRRPSEGGQPQAGADGTSVAGADQPPADPNNPSPPGSPQPPAPPAAGVPGMPQSPVSAFPGIPSSPYNPGGQQQIPPTPGMPTQPSGATPFNGGGVGQSGIDPTQGGGGQSAADLLNGLLTRPRPMPGSDGSSSANGMGTGMGNGLGTGTGTGIGGAGMGGSQTGGIAGVASKVEKASIKIYKDYQHYNEWEFIYDYAQDRTGAGNAAAAMGGAAQQQGGQTPNGGAGFGASNGPTGSGGTFGGASAPSAFGGGTSPQAASSSGGSGGSSGSSSGGGGGVGSGLGVVIGSGPSGSPGSPSGGSPSGGQPQQPPPQAGPLPPPQTTNPPN